METKYCSRCDTTKALAEFSSDRSTKDRLSARCKQCRREYTKSWYERLGKDARRSNGYFTTERRVAYQREYHFRTRARRAELSKKWIENNLDKHRALTREAMRRHRATAKGKLQNNVARALHRALRGRKNGEAAFSLLKFTVEELIVHLERQFRRGMGWENYGKWHVDHIVPLASFNYSEPSDPDFARAWALTNLRPLWAKENISKGGRVSLLL
jgi:hypothetical protein